MWRTNFALQRRGSRSNNFVHAHSSSKYSKKKLRFDFQEALQRDRSRIEKLKASGWKQRLESLRVYPWKSFIFFMAAWSYLGLYAVPYLKEANQRKVGNIRQKQS